MNGGYYGRNNINVQRNTGRKRRRRKSKASAVFTLAIIAVCIVAAAVIIVKVASGIAGGDDTKQAGGGQSGTVIDEAKPEKTYNIPPASEENDLLKIATSVADKEKKVCYLTFDDGPTKENTPKILDILKRYNVKATFFCLGKMLDANSDIAKREYDEGHLLANHSYNHEYADLYATADSFMSEINKTEETIERITGEKPFKLIRFPGGSHNAGSYAAAKQEYKKVLKDNGYYYADWNCLNGDAEASLRSVEQLVSRTKETAVGKNIVVLMHDAAAKTTTPEALGTIIEYLKAQGYEFKRLDEVNYYGVDEPKENESSMIL